MKRIIYLISVVYILSFLLSGCSFFHRPSNVSNNCYDLGMNVIKITDEYLDKKITAVVAAGQIQDLCRILSALPEQEGVDDQIVKNYCEILSYTFMRISEGDGELYMDVLSIRNYLADTLGEVSRS